MKIKYLIAASVAALMVSGTAKAADIVHYQEPQFAPAFSWTGLYGGGEIGWGFGEAKNTLSDKATHARLGKRKLKPDGFKGGFYAGYNFQFSDSILVGIDTDFLFSDVSEKKGVKNLAGTSVGVRQRWDGATRLRVGYGLDRFLPYLAAGVSYADIKTTVVRDGAKVSKAKTRAGWNIGVGVDYAMTDHIILRAEYRYTDFGKKTSNYGAVRDKAKFNENDIRLGVAYKF